MKAKSPATSKIFFLFSFSTPEYRIFDHLALLGTENSDKVRSFGIKQLECELGEKKVNWQLKGHS